MRGGGLGRSLVFPMFGLGLVVLIVAGLWPKPVGVDVAKVSRGALSVSVLEEGKTRIRHRYVVSATFAGSLKRIALRAGDRVEAGKTLLAELQGEWAGFLNPRVFAEAEVRVKATDASRKRSIEGMERAQAGLDLALKEQVRSESLKATGVISSREWEVAVNQVEVLTRELRSAEYSRQVAEFEYEQAQVALRQVQGPSEGLAGGHQLVAPVSGVVLNVFEESARFVNAGAALLEVGDPLELEAEIELLSSDAVGVSVGAPVAIEHWGGGRPLNGRVSTIEPSAYTKISALGVEEQRVKVRVDFVDALPEPRLLGDRFRVEARIRTWSGGDVLQVPVGALFRRGGEWQVFVKDVQVAKVVAVGVGHQNGVMAEVLSGLSEGQTVILHAPDTVADGKPVQERSVKGH